MDWFVRRPFVLPCTTLAVTPLSGFQEALRGLLYRKAGVHDGKMRKDILYADFVLRESARQASAESKNSLSAHATKRRHQMMLPTSCSMQPCFLSLSMWWGVTCLVRLPMFPCHTDGRNSFNLFPLILAGDGDCLRLRKRACGRRRSPRREATRRFRPRGTSREDRTGTTIK